MESGMVMVFFSIRMDFASKGSSKMGADMVMEF